MARTRCSGRFLSGLALLAVSALCSCWSRTSVSHGPAFAQGQSPIVFVVNLLLYQLPGLFLAAAGSLLAGVTVRYASGRLKYPVVVALALMALLTAQMLRSASLIPGGRLDPSKTSSSRDATPIPKSGEEIWKDGAFKRIHDPRSPDGEVVDGEWPRLIWGEMNKAVKEGTDQVVVMFSTRGCGYCDKQIASLRKAIKAREMAKQGAETVLFGDTLRVFVFDAEEFPSIIPKLGIQAFPTSLFFGLPGVSPRIHTGYLDDEKLDMMLKELAREKPGGMKRKRRRGLFGLR